MSTQKIRDLCQAVEESGKVAPRICSIPHPMDEKLSWYQQSDVLTYCWSTRAPQEPGPEADLWAQACLNPANGYRGLVKCIEWNKKRVDNNLFLPNNPIESERMIYDRCNRFLD
jgi:hypothetical protein